MSNSLATRETQGDVMEAVVAKGDLSKLTPQERATYYVRVCQSMGLNPLTQPLQYITLNGKLVLYSSRGATDQLRAIHKVSIRITQRERIDDLYVVTAEATTPDGRTDSEIGVVNVKGLAGEALANAMMKASTKAKRRVTLSLVGLGWSDESEIDSIPNARRVAVDAEGVILDDDPIGQLEAGDSHPPTWCPVCEEETRVQKVSNKDPNVSGWVCTVDPKHPFEIVK